MVTRSDKQIDIADVARLLESLTQVQVEVVHAIVKGFSEEQVSELIRRDFLTEPAFEYFSMRLAAHHAYSSNVLKKENFEHILEQAFKRTGVLAARAESMTTRGADLAVAGVMLSLKTEASKGLQATRITISKLMEAAWIKRITSTDDLPAFIDKMVMPHFTNYDRIFILRSYRDRERDGFIRYDFHEIPKVLFEQIGQLTAEDFSPLTPTRTTSAQVSFRGSPAFRFRLDGSDDKLTITQLDTALCPLHAWWSLAAPT